MIEDGVNGLLVPRRPAALAAAWTRLLDDTPLAKRLAAAARRPRHRAIHRRAMVAATLAQYREHLATIC